MIDNSRDWKERGRRVKEIVRETRGGGKEREKKKKQWPMKEKKKKTPNSLEFSAADPIGSGCGGRSGSA